LECYFIFINYNFSILKISERALPGLHGIFVPAVKSLKNEINKKFEQNIIGILIFESKVI